jgi:hypothetical protein
MQQQPQQPQSSMGLPSPDDITLPLPPTPPATLVPSEAAADAPTTTKSYHLLLDVYRGLVLGAYALDDLHLPGMGVWIVAGFLPVVGSCAAVRDGYYAFEAQEWGAFMLNLVGLLPFMKGVANVMVALRFLRLGRVSRVAHRMARATRRGRVLGAGTQKAAQTLTGEMHGVGAIALVAKQDDAPVRNRAAPLALLLALITAVVSLPELIIFLATGVLDTTTRLSATLSLPDAIAAASIGLLWSIGVLILATRARRRSRQLKGRPFSRSILSTLALWLAWFDLLVWVLLAITGIYLYFVMHALVR